jgi:hypothetical protein
MLISFLASCIVMTTTLSSMKIVAGTKRRTAIGAMYISRFMELIFSLRVDKSFNFNTTHRHRFGRGKPVVICDPRHYPSEDIRIPCKTVLSALAAVAPTHMMNPNRLKLGSPCKEFE